MKYIDINCDMGENRGDDKAVINYISSANIACGGHAGDANTIKRTIELALNNGVAAGAHPGYPDKDGFGRIERGLGAGEILETVLSQLADFYTISAFMGTGISHIKFHGALYNRAAGDYSLMSVLVKKIVDEFGRAPFYTLAGSASEQAVLDAGCRLYREGFADRAYDDSGILVSRTIAGAVLQDEHFIERRVLDIVTGCPVKSINGKTINLNVDTICVHGDTPGSVEMAVGIHDLLKDNGIFIGRT